MGPPYKLEISDTINEGYEEESKPSRGNDTLTVVHNWITEYTFSMSDNTDGAWEIKRNGETDDQYITIPTKSASFLTRNDQTSMSADVSDVYILRLKAELPANNYNRNLILNGTAKDSSVVTQESTLVNGIVSVKPPCCDGFVAIKYGHLQKETEWKLLLLLETGVLRFGLLILMMVENCVFHLICPDLLQLCIV